MGLERKAVLRAAPAHTVHYERRRPEETVLHGLVREHLERFLAEVQARTGTGLPGFVKEEFDAFLECGILAHGFLRVRCAGCAHEKRVAFSCKRRGFCPSCGARRMAQSAAVLVDEVIFQVPVRQWVLSFPIGLRILFAARPELLTPVLRLIHRVIAGFVLRQAGLKRVTADTGAVTLIQRFGSAVNLNIHLHCRHRAAGGDREDPHPPGSAGEGAAARTGAAAGALSGGAIPEGNNGSATGPTIPHGLRSCGGGQRASKSGNSGRFRGRIVIESGESLPETA
ncbi:MAG: hypothetical protein FJY54_09490 [Betaproteobacteria bacterium]|nr:hypothetical protein [Betaproteobacteria bacterium]